MGISKFKKISIKLMFLTKKRFFVKNPVKLWMWSERWDSNPRPPGPEPGALPSCATSR